jgi:uncharacterized protein (DUF983 family)
MKRNPRPIIPTLWRCLKLQCPACGRAAIVERPFNLKHRCTACGVIFKREEGFFVGAIMANVLATEATILIAYFICLLLISNEQTMLKILFIVGGTFPIAFYHHSWALWLGMDHLIEGLPRGNK